MKRLLVIGAIITGTIIYLLSAAWAFEHMDLYIKPPAEAEVGNRVEGGRLETGHVSLQTDPKVSLDKELYDKNVGITVERHYYYALSEIVFRANIVRSV